MVFLNKNNRDIYFYLMDSVWLNVNETKETNKKPYMGIFTADPALIASKLPRPTTPFRSQNRFFPINSTKSDHYFSNNLTLDSPVATDTHNVFKYRSQPLISVF